MVITYTLIVSSSVVGKKFRDGFRFTRFSTHVSQPASPDKKLKFAADSFGTVFFESLFILAHTTRVSYNGIFVETTDEI